MALGFVRAARPEDAAEIARIQLSTWRSSYRRMFPPHVLANLDEAYLTRGWSEAIESAPSGRHRVLIAVEQSEATTTVVGFAAAGPADEQALVPDEPALADDVAAITDLLIEPRWGRRGHGSRLLAAVVDRWREDGFATAVAWAYEQDKAMRAFLASAGWEPDGAGRALDVDDMLVPQLRLHVGLGPDAPGGQGASLSEAGALEAGALETDALETDAPETDAPETDAPKTGAAPGGAEAAGANATPRGTEAAGANATPRGTEAADANATPRGTEAADANATPRGTNATDANATASGTYATGAKVTSGEGGE